MSIETTGERLWRILSGIRRCSAAPRPMGRPSLTSTQFVSQLVEKSRKKEEFMKLVAESAALRTWAGACPDGELAYLIWLERKKIPSAA